jgi:Calcium binding
MKKPAKDRIREERIRNEVIVDAYGPQEQVMGWYYYLDGKMRFPFQAAAPSPEQCRRSGRGKLSKSGAWLRKRPVRATCLC